MLKKILAAPIITQGSIWLQRTGEQDRAFYKQVRVTRSNSAGF